MKMNCVCFDNILFMLSWVMNDNATGKMMFKI